MNKFHLVVTGFLAVYVGLALRSALKNWANVTL